MMMRLRTISHSCALSLRRNETTLNVSSLTFWVSSSWRCNSSLLAVRPHQFELWTCSSHNPIKWFQDNSHCKHWLSTGGQTAQSTLTHTQRLHLWPMKLLNCWVTSLSLINMRLFLSDIFSVSHTHTHTSTQLHYSPAWWDYWSTP